MSMQGYWRQFSKNQQASVLIEFAVALPILLIILTGVIELSRYALFRQKFEATAVQMLDLTTQSTNVNAASFDALRGTIPEMMKPYALTGARVIFTQVVRPYSGTPGVDCQPVVLWQYPLGGSSVSNGPGTYPELDGLDLVVGDNIMTIELIGSYRPMLFNFISAGWLGGLESSIVRYGRTRYGEFTIDPVTDAPIQAVCNS